VRFLIFAMICGVVTTAVAGECAGAGQPDGDPPRDPYVLDWWTMDGGGGPSAGGVYDVLGTLGQPDVGRAIGGSYLLSGGFLAGSDTSLVFAEGFELGDTSAWSATTGSAKHGGGE
jgi:hypothetical protein